MEVVFKPYQQDQLSLLPSSLEELIPKHHLVRVVNDAVEKMDLTPLIKSYTGGGTSSYHPKMLLKVLIYGYVTKTYSSRRLAKALRENINFMWLSGNNHPDFRTINNFRSSRLKDFIDTVFGSTLELLIEAKLVKLEDYFQDGSTIEADANKHSYVWKKTVARNKEKLQKRIKELIVRIDEINQQEESEYGERDLEEMGEESTITSEKVKEKIEDLNKKLKEIAADSTTDSLEKTDKKNHREQTGISRKLTKELLPKLEHYEDQERKLGKRNSYSKTDVDATFFQLKSNGFGNKELKPGYNIQLGTEDQFIVGYSVHQTASDTVTMIPHLEKLKGQLKDVTGKYSLPKNIIADAGYGSEENYQYLEKENVNGYVKFNMYDIEKTKRYRENNFRVENLLYNKERDEYICPAGKSLKYLKSIFRITKTGYQIVNRLYQSEGCEGCTLRSQCHKSHEDRIIRISQKLNEYRSRARELLETDIGRYYRKKRSTDVESVFGDIKRNREFRRFNLRGIKKANIEIGIVSIAHNMIKWWKKTTAKEMKTKIAVAI